MLFVLTVGGRISQKEKQERVIVVNLVERTSLSKQELYLRNQTSLSRSGCMPSIPFV